MTAKSEEAICSVAALATQLGNQISVHMLKYISTTKDLPDGFRELSHTFLDTCRTLWAIEAGVTELAAANRALPEVIIEEVEKKFVSTYRDFQQLDKVILKLVHYEHRGTLGKLQRGWHRPGHELSRIHESLKKATETLRISGMAFHWSLGDAHPEESVGTGYAGLAAALDRVSKGRSVMGINKAKTFESERSVPSIQSQLPDSMRSTPSVPPKESFTAARPSQGLRQQDPEINTDDMSSVLSLNGYSEPDSASARLTQTLLAHGVNLEDETRNGTTLLIEAIRKRAPQQAIETLLNSGCDPNRKDDHGKTALCEAVQSDQPAIVTTLLNQDANPNMPGPEHVLWSAVHRPGCLRILLARGADVRKTPGLMEQATKMLGWLLAHGADPNLRGQDWPVYMATQSPSMLRLLLPSITDLSAHKGVMEKAVQANQLENVKLLLAAGANVEWKNGGVFSPLTTALRERYWVIVRYLLDEAGADPNAPGEHLPLVKAIRRCDDATPGKGADPNKCYRDWNAIMQAIEDRDLRLLQLLIEKGGRANLAQKDEMDKTVLDMANSSGWLEGTEVLLNNAHQ
ncbi:uncharacterized protein N7446_011837 [Penicillium canescens]|uniref:uncharacterized protein n=1 Tax=Penicillium canescens TaxID=5083 RepID=UPI0026DF9514|nr:uncharacterized protein N7446_011837 [Penicillium canescens]KAJ6047003.1 hypothetical protein N7446_011837 [Penicillium canescens]